MVKIYRISLSKYPFFEKLYFFMIVIYAAMAIPATNCMMYYADSVLGFIIPIIMTIILITRNKIRFEKRFWYVLLVLSVWIILQIIISGQINSTLTIFLYYNLIIAFILIKVYKENLWLFYEYYVTILSLFCLIVWLLVLIAPFLMIPLIHSLSIVGVSNHIAESNIIIFTLTKASYYNSIIMRNSGFSWEPGRYAILVMLAMFFNLLRNKFNIKKNRGFWILLLALISTQSTTGITAFIFLLIPFARRFKSISARNIFYVISLTGILFLFSTDEYGGKISKNWYNPDTIERASETSDNSIKGSYALQRIDGAVVNIISFFHDPILGWGMDDQKAFYKQKWGQVVSSPNGNFKLFAKYGIIIALLVLFCLYKTSIYLSEKYKSCGKLFYLIFYLILLMSYDFWTVPIFFAMTLFVYFGGNRKKIMKKQIQNEELTTPNLVGR